MQIALFTYIPGAKTPASLDQHYKLVATSLHSDIPEPDTRAARFAFAKLRKARSA